MDEQKLSGLKPDRLSEKNPDDPKTTTSGGSLASLSPGPRPDTSKENPLPFDPPDSLPDTDFPDTEKEQGLREEG